MIKFGSHNRTLWKILVLLTVAFIFSRTLVAQDWYNTGWDYRVPVAITNSGSHLTDFQVKVSLDETFAWSHVHAGGADIRFTDSDGTSVLPYWIESWTHGSSAVLWVRVPTVSVLPGTGTIFMYYGNSLAPTGSDGSSTFNFFDDFESGTLNSTKWHTAGAPAYSFLQDEGSMVISMTGTGTHLVYIASNDISFSNFILEMKVKMTVDINNNCTPEVGFRLTNDNNKYITMLRGESLIGGGGPNGDLFIRRYENGVQTNPTPYPAYNYLANTYYRYQVAANADTIIQNLNNTLIRSWKDTGTGILSGGINLLNFGGITTNPVYYDDVRIRSYANPEPLTMTGFEQNQYPPLNISYVVEDVSCYGASDGAVNISVSGGSGSYIYLWTPGGFSSEDLSGVPAGIYHLHVEDVNGQNMGDQTITIGQPAPLSSSFTVTVPFDCIAGQATIVVSASGGTPPYTGTGSFVQAAGTVNYTITDSGGCQLVLPVSIGPDGSWFHPDWIHRMPFEIMNPGGSPLTDFQVEVILDGTFNFSDASADGSDIRFTLSDGTTIIPHWIERWETGTVANLWVRVPSIAAAGDRIYMYYGNGLAIGASNGSATFRFFDDFSTFDSSPGNWIRRLLWTGSDWSGLVVHDWKYSMEMQQGALFYSIERADNGWPIEALDSEIAQEFDFIHSQINPDGTVVTDAYLTAEPQYCYGLIMSNLALGYLYFSDINPTLAARCYDDLILVFDRLRVIYPTVGTVSDAGGYGMMLMGFSNAWKAFSGRDVTRAGQANSVAQSYATSFLANQAVGGSWNGANGVQEHLKRNFGMLLAYDVTGNASYLTAVDLNISYLLEAFWLSGNGGLEWYVNHATSNHFYECHQQWFMIAVRMLYNKSGGTFDYLAEGLQAWHFLTDNNYAGIDMYVHNLVNHGAFFSYRQVLETGAIQSDNFKGSYEIGAALWGMSLNYAWVSSYQSSHSTGAYNYLDEMVRQVKKTPAEKGFLNTGSAGPSSVLWRRVGNPVASIVNDNGNNVLSLRGNLNHTDLYTTLETGFDDFILEARVRMTADGNLLCNPVVDFRYTDVNNRYMTQLRGEPQNDFFFRRYEGGVSADLSAAPYNYVANQYYDYRIQAAGSGTRAWMDDLMILDFTDNVTSIASGGISLRNYEDNNAAWFDDVRIRRFAEFPPTTVPGSEETPSRWTGNVSTDWDNLLNWIGGLPGGCSVVTISAAPVNLPHISTPVECFHMTINSDSQIIIDPNGSLTVNGDLNNTGVLIISSTLVESGSLIVSGNSTGNITYNRQLKVGTAAGSDWHLAASPVASNTEANAGKVNTVYQWSELTGAWTTTGITSALPGRGYNIRQEAGSDGMISFTGPLVNTDISVEVSSPFADAVGPDDNYFERSFVAGRSLQSPGGKGWNLLGNPYPSAIRVDDFITANFSPTPALSQFDPNYVALYLFDGTAQRYYYLASSTGWPSGVELNETHVQAGQGFFVLAMNDNSEFRFTRTMQEHSTGTAMLKSGSADNRWPGLQLKMQSESDEAVTTVVYGERMSSGVDPGYDIGLYRSGQDIDLYTKLVEKDNGVLYARQALPTAWADTIVVAVGVDFAKGGEVVFSASTVPVGGRRFWLEDRATGIFTELGLKSYTVNFPANTLGTGRFYLVASSNTPSNSLTPEVQSGLQIWAVNGKVVIRGMVSEGAICEIIALNGGTIAELRLSGGEHNTVVLPADIHGIYIVRVIEGSRVKTRKVLIP